MNGRVAKKLRKQAEAIVLSLDKKVGEGFNTYDQAQNCLAWVPSFEKDGKRRVDADGVPLLQQKWSPGTIRCGWHTRVVYQWLKRKYYSNLSQ